MKHNPLILMQTQLASFSPVGQKIAKAILEDPERVVDVSIQQLAREISVSEASIVRFCRTLGLEGFSDLKMALLKNAAPTQIPSVFEEIDENDSMEAVARNVFVRNLNTLQIAMQRLDFGAVTAAAELLRNARKIVILGSAASASIAENFYIHLFRVGFPASVETDGEFMQVAAHMADEHTVFIAVSRGGRTKAVVNAFEEARRRGAKTISITANDNTPLARASDIPIIHYAPVQALASTRVVQNTVIDCLYVCATRHRQQEVVDRITENRRLAEFLYIK
jgi:DNA-binding MurR/RpiR family transcriptional regulator